MRRYSEKLRTIKAESLIDVARHPAPHISIARLTLRRPAQISQEYVNEVESALPKVDVWIPITAYNIDRVIQSSS